MTVDIVYYCVNTRHIVKNNEALLLASVNSVRENRNPDTTVNIHIISKGIGERTRYFLDGMAEDGFTVKYINAEDSTDTNSLRGIYMGKTQAFGLLDRSIYLDCDTIVRTDLSEMYSIDLEGKVFAGCRDPISITRGEDYINSGVLVVDGKAFREHDDPSKHVKYARMYGLSDQEYVNREFSFKCIDPVYNVMLNFYLGHSIESLNSINGSGFSSFDDYISKAKILHFLGSAKPYFNADEKASEEWYGYFSRFTKHSRMIEFEMDPYDAACLTGKSFSVKAPDNLSGHGAVYMNPWTVSCGQHPSYVVKVPDGNTVTDPLLAENLCRVLSLKPVDLTKAALLVSEGIGKKEW